MVRVVEVGEVSAGSQAVKRLFSQGELGGSRHTSDWLDRPFISLVLPLGVFQGNPPSNPELHREIRKFRPGLVFPSDLTTQGRLFTHWPHSHNPKLRVSRCLLASPKTR